MNKCLMDDMEPRCRFQWVSYLATLCLESKWCLHIGGKAPSEALAEGCGLLRSAVSVSYGRTGCRSNVVDVHAVQPCSEALPQDMTPVGSAAVSR